MLESILELDPCAHIVHGNKWKEGVSLNQKVLCFPKTASNS